MLTPIEIIIPVIIEQGFTIIDQGLSYSIVISKKEVNREKYIWISFNDAILYLGITYDPMIYGDVYNLGNGLPAGWSFNVNLAEPDSFSELAAILNCDPSEYPDNTRLTINKIDGIWKVLNLEET